MSEEQNGKDKDKKNKETTLNVEEYQRRWERILQDTSEQIKKVRGER
jgi:hypothetical protein